MNHVILVDPAPTRDVLAERLRMQGYQVTATADVAQGAHLALSEPPAVVIADLWMPGISGVQLCRLLKSEAATLHVPVILRGPDASGRPRFWAERAGAVAYVTSGSMGDLVRAIARAIASSPPQEDAFFTQLSGGESDLRDRIAAHLDGALFESVIAAEVRALGVCGSFDRLFDLLSQCVAQVASYRWLAVHTPNPDRVGVHAHPDSAVRTGQEVRAVLGLPADTAWLGVEDADAQADTDGPSPIIENIVLGGEVLGRIALAPRHPAQPQDAELIRVVARELGGPIRIATLIEASNRLAMMDTLTGLMNRRAFIAGMKKEIGRLERHGDPMCVMLLDVDHFKQVNDKRGHAIGDAVLAALGGLLPTQIRRTDYAARWGGEEFVVALTVTGETGAVGRAESIRKAITELVVYDAEGERVPISASIGVAAARSGDAVEQLIARADRAMYAAKHAGRNRVVLDAPVTPVETAADIH